VEQLLRDVSEGESAAGSRDARGERERALAEAERTSEVRAEQRRGLLQERMRRIHELHDRRLHELALASARKLVHDFPGEPEAEQLYGELIDAAHEARRLDNDERKRELRAEVLARIEESLIPTGFDGKPIYPSDWADRRAGHQDASFGELAFEPWHQALLDRLSTRVTFDFQDVAVDEALAFLAKQAAMNVIVDPAVYAGGAKSVTLRATDLTVRNALNWIGQLTGARWTIAKGAVYFGGTEDEEGVLALYDLGHISIAPPDFPGYTLGWSNAGGATGGTQNIFTAPEDPEPQMSPEDLVDLIKSAVSPTTWENPAYTIEIRTGSLFVTAPRSVHALVKQFIRSQAHARALAVQVDAKWLTVSDIYLEEIGVDWSGASNLLRIGGSVAPPPGYQQGNQTAAWRGDVTNVLPANAANIQPALANTGLNLSLLHIDGGTVGAMLSAVERKGRGRVLQAPSVATLNGVRGSCFFGNQLAYIADYEVGGGGQGVGAALDPVIEVLAVGASLDITPHVSADGKYVTMDFRPAIATVELFVEVIQAISLRQTGTVIGPNGQIIDTFTGTLVDLPIELPNVAIRAVSTRIMVPDQGTILVGGFGKHVDQQASSKVPFLGHIPFFGRLFGKRGRYSDRSQLYLMATVQIINYQEAEKNL
ncbi:MAG: hypothetical protein H0W72_11985, partial [Planctomycetes bacterium]|nr:hypothetical protein [Planctomycetota bacterium]